MLAKELFRELEAQEIIGEQAHPFLSAKYIFYERLNMLGKLEAVSLANFV
jgi:hypothetical protein